MTAGSAAHPNQLREPALVQSLRFGFDPAQRTVGT